MTDRIAISDPLREFFEGEERNARQAIAHGDLDVDHPLTLSTALDSLRQAPTDVQLRWMTDNEQAGLPPDEMTADDLDGIWTEAFTTLLELANLLDLYGGDTSLMEWLR